MAAAAASGPLTLLALSDWMILDILARLPAQDLIRVAQTCRRLGMLVQSDDLWNVEQLTARFPRSCVVPGPVNPGPLSANELRVLTLQMQKIVNPPISGLECCKKFCRQLPKARVEEAEAARVLLKKMFEVDDVKLHV